MDKKALPLVTEYIAISNLAVQLLLISIVRCTHYLGNSGNTQVLIISNNKDNTALLL